MTVRSMNPEPAAVNRKKHSHLSFPDLVGVPIQIHFLEQLGDVLRRGGGSFREQNPELLQKLLLEEKNPD